MFSLVLGNHHLARNGTALQIYITNLRLSDSTFYQLPPPQFNQWKAQLKRHPSCEVTLFQKKKLCPQRTASINVLRKYVGSWRSIYLFKKIVIPSMPSTDCNCIYGNQSSRPRFSLVRPPTPELLSSHHAADYCSGRQHLISSCQLQHGNLISSSQLEPGELLRGNVNSSV